MLELTLGRPGKDQQIATIQELASKGLVFNSDELEIIIGSPREAIDYLLRAMVESGCLSIIHVGPKMYYSECIPIDSKIILESDHMDPGHDLSLLADMVKDLQLEVDRTTATIDTKEEELDRLDELTEKWRDCTVELFQDIRSKWSQPLSLKQLAIQAGFDPDTLEIDFEDIDTSE